MVWSQRHHITHLANRNKLNYSGHGSQELSPPEFWHLEPDHLDETLVCYDSRLNGGWDLADKELGQLITEVAARGPHIVVVLDACHSGSGTRAPEDAGVRHVATDKRVRPLQSFLMTAAQAMARHSTTSGNDTGSGWLTLSSGRHVVLAACRAEEEAKERMLGGEQRGVFSYHLLDTLQRSGPSLSYRDLFKRVSSLVRNTVAQQSPQLEATATEDLARRFLGDTIAPRAPYFTMSHQRGQGWIIDGGAVHGIPQPQDAETTTLALFPAGQDLSKLRSLADALGSAQVTEVFPATSRVAVVPRDGSSLLEDQTFKAVVVALPLPPVLVALHGQEEALQLVRDSLAAAGPERAPSLLVREARQGEAAELSVEAENERYRIRRVGDSYPLVVDVRGFDRANAALAVEQLEHIARWLRIVRLENKTSRIAPGDIRMEFYHIDPAEPSAAGPGRLLDDSAELRLEYSYQDGTWVSPKWRIKLVNTSDRRLYCMLLDLTETYAVSTAGLLPGGGIWLEPAGAIGAEAWMQRRGGAPFSAFIPPELHTQGVVQLRDVLKLIVSSEEADATLLEQGELMVTRDLGFTRSPGKLAALNTLNRLMRRVQVRGLGSDPEEEESFVDWTTSQIVLTTLRPSIAVPVPEPGGTVVLGAGVTLEGHPALHGKARLTVQSVASRDLGNLMLPPLLRDDPTITQPFQFSQGRGGEPGLSVLELVEVEGYAAVTPEQPLVVRTEDSLGPDAHLLPIGFDGEFFLPLGRADRTMDGMEIVLERLPAPTSGGSRDLKGSIKILFQKIVGQRLGQEYPYPILAAASVADDGSVTYTAQTNSVREHVAAARRIVLYLHGIIGDTRSMAGSARHALPMAEPPVPLLAERYDLILTFDYENINTAIEETARGLKQRLEAVGLGPGHGKTLHVVAHSMGGLVARWFIERESGNQVVQRLVMLGTPNDGSPWPTVQAWATPALAIGLNSLAGVAWPAKILGSLVGAIETVDVALDQMEPGSTLLQSLAASLDPGIPYTILAGNTSLLVAALMPEQPEQPSRLERLLDSLRLPTLLHKATALAFFGQPNDIAVSVRSIGAVPLARDPQPVIHEVACDHITYFSTEAGLWALVASLP